MRMNPWYLATWLLLVLLALFPVLFSVLDLAGIARSGIPSDHLDAYRALAGQAFGSASSGPESYIKHLEIGYALHELTFGLFFLVIVAIPLRLGQRWAWWACWIAMISTVGYSFTFAQFSPRTLAYSLVPDIGIPLLLLAQAPRFWASLATAQRSASGMSPGHSTRS